MCVWVRPYLVSAITVKINEHEGMVKCMKFFDRISETLGLYEEEDDELLEEEEPVKKAETAPKRIPRSRQQGSTSRRVCRFGKKRSQK